MKKISGPYIAALASIGIAGTVLVAAVLWLPPLRQEELGAEIAKAAIQIFPLAFFGVIVADLVRQRDERRTEDRRAEDRALELEQKRDEFRRRFLDDVIIAYNRAKAIRRSLRGAGLGPTAKGSITKEHLHQLDTQLAGLSEAQLDLERLKREATAQGEVFTQVAVIRGSLRDLED